MNYPALKILPLITTLALVGCGGGGDSDDSGGGTPANNNALTISLTGVVTLVEQTQTTEVTTRSLSRNTDTTFNTNLFGLDEAGNITYPLSGVDINVSLIVPGPEQYDASGNALGSNELWIYNQTSSITNPGEPSSSCTLIRIDMSNSSYDCPIGNTTIETSSYSTSRYTDIRFDIRPIQFDSNNDIYLVIDGRLTKLDRSNNYSQNPLTPDNQEVWLFAILSTDEIVFSGSGSPTPLKLLQSGSIYTINAGVSSFAIDYANTIIAAGGTNGTEYVRPRSDGGFNRAPMQYYSGDVQLGDDGALYSRSYGELSRLLPYDPMPFITGIGGRVKLAQNFAYYTDSKTHANYGEYDIISLTNLSTREETVLFDATTAEFDAGAPRYDIFNFNVSGTTLMFSALDQGNNEVKLGQIDMIKLRQGAAESEYLSFINVSSAVNASNSVRAMVSIKPRQPAFDPGAAPYISKYHFNNTNPYSLGINFSKYMDKASVEQNLSLLDTDNANATVAYIPFWIQQNLFLIPDTSPQEFSDSDSAPLKLGNQYQLSLASNTLDAYGWMLSDGDTNTYPLSTNLNTQPSSGFFQPDQTLTATANAVSSGKVAMIDKSKNSRTNHFYDYYDLGVDISGNVRIEFSSFGNGNNSTFYIADTAYDYINTYNSALYNYGVADITINSNYNCSYLNYKTSTTSTSEATNTAMYSPNPTPCNNYKQWLRYRLDLFGTNVRWSYSSDGATYISILDESDINDLLDRDGVSNRTLILETGVSPNESLDDRYQLLDNIKIQRLNTDGSLADTSIPANTLLDLSFDNNLKVSSDDVEGDNKGFDDEVGTLYGASN